MYKLLIVFGLFSLLTSSAFAQKPDTLKVSNKTDSVTRAADSLHSKRFRPDKKMREKVYHPDSLHDPHKAVIHSLIIPGWGQVYNHQWWKVPLIYGGLTGLASIIIFNQRYYSEYIAIAKYQEHGYTPKPTDAYYTEYNYYVNTLSVQSSAIVNAADFHRRNRDLAILGTLGFWGVQVIDAYITAKFQHSYTMDNNLSIHVQPTVLGQPMYALASSNNVSLVTGLKITFTF